MGWCRWIARRSICIGVGEDGKIKSMLLPRFSTRMLFAIVAACGVVFAFAAWGMEGAAWAAAVAIGALVVAVTLCVHAAVYLVLQAANRVLRRRQPAKATVVGEVVEVEAESPFRTDEA